SAAPTEPSRKRSSRVFGCPMVARSRLQARSAPRAPTGRPPHSANEGRADATALVRRLAGRALDPLAPGTRASTRAPSWDVVLARRRRREHLRELNRAAAGSARLRLALSRTRGGFAPFLRRQDL